MPFLFYGNSLLYVEIIMISKKLNSRLKYIEATPLKNRAKTSVASRRDLNSIMMDDQDVELDKYDTFFEYEEELADLKASGEQYKEIYDESPFVILEEDNDINSSISIPIIMEETGVVQDVDPKDELNLLHDIKQNKSYTDVVGFKFIQCEYVKKDGEQCKRQAPKNGTICSTHKKYIKKHADN